jgi:hypothetical protein
MPVLGQHHVTKPLDETIDDRHHRVAVGNRERAARAEIILHVDDEKQIIRLNLHRPLHWNDAWTLGESDRFRSR